MGYDDSLDGLKLFYEIFGQEKLFEMSGGLTGSIEALEKNGKQKNKEEEEKMDTFKVGDRVKCIVAGNGFGFGQDLEVGKIYTVLKNGSANCVQVDDGKPWEYLAARFTLAEKPVEEFKVGDRVEALQRLGERLRKSSLDAAFGRPSSESVPPAPVEMVVNAPVSITHEGQATTTDFADGSKMVTKPSADDVDKYDPYTGFCVAMTAKMFGSKSAAKEFYQKHAQAKVAQAKVAQLPFKVGDIIRGTKNNGYTYTTDAVAMRVITLWPLRDSRNMVVQILTRGTEYTETYYVDNTLAKFELLHRPEASDGASK